MNFPEDLKYTKEHEWIRVEGNIGTIGVTDHAQGELGDIVYIDISSNVDAVAQGEAFGTIEAVKTVADLYAPVAGKIVEVNTALNDAPETVNTDPYGAGWLVRIEIADMAQVDGLLDVAAYKDLIGQ